MQIKVLALFLALFLASMPDASPFVNYTNWQEVCTEEICDVEEEALIRTPQQKQQQVQVSLESISDSFRPVPVQTPLHLFHHCFDRQWLKCHRLRL